jgi:hypothetical protein
MIKNQQNQTCNNDDDDDEATVVAISFHDLEAFYYQKFHEEEEATERNQQPMAYSRRERNEGKPEIEERLVDAIGSSFGSHSQCLGILRVTDIPFDIFGAYRAILLPLARDIGTVAGVRHDWHLEDAGSMFSVGWSHGKEQLARGKPDIAKGSYYANPLTDNIVEAIISRNHSSQLHSTNDPTDQYWLQQAQMFPEFYAPNVWPPPLNQSADQFETISSKLDEIKDGTSNDRHDDDEDDSNDLVPVQTMCLRVRRDFKSSFCMLAQTIHRMGIMVAAVCDEYCYRNSSMKDNLSFQESSKSLHQVLSKSLNCKARLLHYFSPLSSPQRLCDEQSMWCGWHNDHVSARVVAAHCFALRSF